jgi:hypothetical protein
MSLHDDLLKHQMLVQRLIGTEVASIKTYLAELKKLAIREVNADSSSNAIKDTLRAVMAPLKTTSIGSLIDIAEYESKFSAKLFSKYFSDLAAASEEPTRAMIALNLDDTEQELAILKDVFGSAKEFLGSYKGAQETSYEVPINGIEDLLRIAREYNQESTLLLSDDNSAKLLFSSDASEVPIGTFVKVGKEQPDTESWTKDVNTGEYYTTKTVDPLTDVQLEKALKDTNMSINYLSGGESAQKKSLETAYKQFAQRKADDITQIIKDGRSQGKDAETIISRIGERVAGLLTTQAQSLAQTAINHTTAVARSETIQANPEMSSRVLWVADLEVNEHCEECDGLDGNTYTLDEIEEPPLHWGCACHLEPVGEE